MSSKLWKHYLENATLDFFILCMKLDHIKACQMSLLLVYQNLIWAWHRGQKIKFCPKIKIFGNNLKYLFSNLLHEVRTLKALQTGIVSSLSKYLFYGQLGGQKGSLSRGPLFLRGLLTYI